MGQIVRFDTLELSIVGSVNVHGRFYCQVIRRVEVIPGTLCRLHGESDVSHGGDKIVPFNATTRIRSVEEFIEKTACSVFDGQSLDFRGFVKFFVSKFRLVGSTMLVFLVCSSCWLIRTRSMLLVSLLLL